MCKKKETFIENLFFASILLQTAVIWQTVTTQDNATSVHRRSETIHTSQKHLVLPLRGSEGGSEKEEGVTVYNTLHDNNIQSLAADGYKSVNAVSLFLLTSVITQDDASKQAFDPFPTLTAGWVLLSV